MKNHLWLQLNQLFSTDIVRAQVTRPDVTVEGIAGPGGGSEEKPVGLCYIAARFDEKEIVKKLRFGKERLINKERGAMAGLESLRRLLLDIE